MYIYIYIYKTDACYKLQQYFKYRNFPAVSLKKILPENPKQIAQQQCSCQQASQQEFFLGTTSSVGKLFREIPYGKILPRNLSCVKTAMYEHC